MKFTLLITGAPETSDAAKSAYQFCKAALKAGHEIESVFLMHSGMQLAIVPSKIASAWQAISGKYDFKIQTCITAMERQLIDEEQLKEGFVADGLASLTEASMSSDRVITFH